MSNIFKKNKLISLMLALVLTFSMLFSTAIPTYATNINESGGNGKSKVVTTIEPSIFSATVPYVLPISIDAEQNVYTADNVAISNNSNGPIKVSNATLTTNEGWELVEDGTDFSSVPVNSKQFSMIVLNSPVLTSGSIDTESFGTINGNSSLNVTYDADAAVQGEAISGTNIANVLFTIEWDNVEITSATVNKTALQSFAKTVKTFQKTSERLNIDDVKATDGVTKIDDGVTDKSIYAWSDSNGNGYWWTDAMIAYLPTNCSSLFANFRNLVSLDLSGFDTSNVTNMSYMFDSCYLDVLNVSSFDTSNVINMSYMFRGENIKSLDLSSFDTSKVKDMSHMFDYCRYLKDIDASSFDTFNVTDMSYMFADCNSINMLNVSSFDTSRVTDMSYMFKCCRTISTLDLSSFNTQKVTNMGNMFFQCKKLSYLDLSSFNTKNVTNMEDMFQSCQSIKSLDLSNFNTSSVTDMSAMFCDCSSIESLDLSLFDTSNVTAMSSMFDGCRNLSSLDVSNFNTKNVTEMCYMFRGWNKLVSLDLSSFDTSNTINMNCMFHFSANLQTIYVSKNFVTNNVKYCTNMFTNCKKLVGQNGTSYNSSYTDKTYALIDTADTPGYFTYKEAA